MIHQALLRRAVEGRDQALVDFVDRLAPAILTHFASVPALGGSGRVSSLADPCLPPGLPRISPEARQRFADRHDQSMVTHILNGAFAGMRIAEKLPPAKALNDLEKRLWLLGYVAHDYAKVYGLASSAGELPAIRRAIACLGQRLGFEGLLPAWEEYLDDIVFLAQNTQTVEGANLNLRDFAGLKIHPRRLEVLRLLSSYADVLVHVTSPSEVAMRGADGRDRATNLREKLEILFGAGQAPRLAYHRLTEVRGLLSNLINNAVMAALSASGYEPYLFFPNGVVYLAEPGRVAQADAVALAEAVWARVVDLVSSSDDFGVRRAGTGLIPSSALYELTGLAGLLDAGRRETMGITSSHAAERLYGFLTGESLNDLRRRVGNPERAKELQAEIVEEAGLPHDARVDRLGEFLAFVRRAVADTFRKAPDVAPVLLEWLGLAAEVTVEEATRQKGGTCFGWFFAAARFIQRHEGIDDYQIEELLKELSERTAAWIEGQRLGRRLSPTISDAVKAYVVSHVEVDGALLGGTAGDRGFGAELRGYERNKDSRRPTCSLCSSPYRSAPQEATEVPFGNQQYSNRNPLAVRGPRAVVRGTCPVCRIEMMLRRVQQGAVNEKDKPVQLYLYPTYFFTPETSKMVRHFLDALEDLDLSPFSGTSLIRHLRGKGCGVASVLEYPQYAANPDVEPLDLRRATVRAPRYSENDAAAFFVLSMTPKRVRGRKLTEADAWAVPTLYALLLPLMLSTKVVASASFVPVFGNGADFRETAILDAPHGFTRHVLGRERFRVDELEEHLMRLLRVYDLHLDVFAESSDLHWPQLNALAKDVATDPLYVFQYYERRARGDKSARGKKGGKAQTGGIAAWDVDRYVDIYRALGGDANMGFIGELVDAYAQFYQAEYAKLDSAYAVLRPLMTAIETTVESDPNTTPDDLLLLVAGALNDDQVRVRENKADGWDPIWRNASLGTPQERLVLSRQKIEEFAELFLAKAFMGYCHGDRALLRERANRIRSAARFYYLQHYGRRA